ncbi:MAG TPA: class I SAM-dependent methyltransferase [Vicinamibacteria bacterium]|nr:class I SAM-dependent methyltransferase [Vicinamibacteria bacterium]
MTWTVNGTRFPEVGFGGPREGIKSIYPYVPFAADSGFECYIPLSTIGANNELRISYVWKHDDTALRRDHDLFYFLSDPVSIPSPDPERIERVHGRTSASFFKQSGYSTFRKLDEALKSVVDRGLLEFGDVLDWGCGCGRVSRFFSDTDVRFHGAEIDKDNLGWCRDNLGFGTWHSFPLQPPTGLSDEAFDLVIGVSVFTHLNEATQFAWLEEIRRVLRPGGVAAFSTHGKAVVAQQHTWKDSTLQYYLRRGFIDGPNHDLDKVVTDRSYYRTTCHTKEYILRKWSKYFDILTFVPSYVGNIQDLVIVRKV